MVTGLLSIFLSGLLILLVLALLIALAYGMHRVAKVQDDARVHDDGEFVSQRQQCFLTASIMNSLNQQGSR